MLDRGMKDSTTGNTIRTGPEQRGISRLAAYSGVSGYRQEVFTVLNGNGTT
jgi:hypothetical protein